MHETMHQLTARAVDAPADVAEVRVRDVLDLGQVASRSGARTATPRRPPSSVALDRRRVDAGCQARVDRLEDPAVERHEVRHERHVHPELLLDLGLVPMREHAVRGDAAVHLGEVRALGRRLAGARDAGLRVDDDARLNQPGGDERLQRQDRGRRVAPAEATSGAVPSSLR